MRTERFEFPNAKGEQLAATLDLPLGEPTAFALFASPKTHANIAPKPKRRIITECNMKVVCLRKVLEKARTGGVRE